MSTLSPGEMDLLTSTTDLFSIQALAKMPESDQICLANKYGESCRHLSPFILSLLKLPGNLREMSIHMLERLTSELIQTASFAPNTSIS